MKSCGSFFPSILDQMNCLSFDMFPPNYSISFAICLSFRYIFLSRIPALSNSSFPSWKPLDKLFAVRCWVSCWPNCLKAFCSNSCPSLLVHSIPPFTFSFSSLFYFCFCFHFAFERGRRQNNNEMKMQRQTAEFGCLLKICLEKDRYQKVQIKIAVRWLKMKDLDSTVTPLVKKQFSYFLKAFLS